MATDFKKKLRETIDFIKERTGLKQQDISTEAGYKPNTLAQALAKEDGHEAVVKRLQLVYWHLFTKSTSNLEGILITPHHGKVSKATRLHNDPGEIDITLADHIALLKRHNDFLEYEILQRLKDHDNLLRRIDSNLTIVKEDMLHTGHTSDNIQHEGSQGVKDSGPVADQVQKKVEEQAGLQQEFERKMRRGVQEKGAKGRS